METEDIIKFLLILGVLYLLLNCTLTENFSENGKIKLALLSGGKVYRLVSFFDLKDDYKKIALQILKEDYDAEVKANLSVAADKKTNNSFIAAGIENALINATPESISQLTSKNISKVPVFIIANDKIDEYTKSVFEFKEPTQIDKGLSPESDKFLYWNHRHQLLFYSSSDRYGREIKGLHKTEDKNKLELEPIKIDDKDIILNKMAEKTKDKFTHYVISKDSGSEFTWKWYSNDLSKIQ